MYYKLPLAVLLLLAGLASPASAQSNALNFDGTNDYVNVPAGSLPSFTIECWVRFTGTTTAGQNIIVYTDAVGPSTNYSHQLFTDASGRFKHYTFDGSQRNITGTTIAALNTWYHVAISAASNGTARLYVNGVQEGTPVGVTSVWANGDRFHIGGSSAFATFLRGSVDELRIWNRELCAGEIAAARNGELLNPTTQSALHRYYKFNQGTASGTNTGVSSLTDASVNAVNGTLINFGLAAGATSNWVSGTISTALPVTHNSWDLMATTSTATTVAISGSTVASNCALISNLAPRAGVPLSGNVAARVEIDGTVQSFAGQPYVPRHYHIEPVTNPNTATATVTLYFTQADFTAYNAARGLLPPLPTSTSDVANAGNLRISQFHGVPTGGYAPGNYPRTWAGSGPARVTITPSSVTYSTTYSRWEVVFPVTGFSGFFATTATTPLPVSLTDFTASLQDDGKVRLQWHAASVGPGDAFEAERSTDGKTFASIGFLNAMKPGMFSLDDKAPESGVNYYRLRILNGGGEAAFSPVRKVVAGSRSYALSLSPLPARDYLKIETNASGLSAVLSDMQGRELRHVELQQLTMLNLQGLPAGIYLLRTSDGSVRKVVKE